MTGKPENPVNVIYNWWEGLVKNSADCARLRRAGSLMKAMLEPATLNLARQLGAKIDDLEDIALIAAILANVRENKTAQSVARMLGTPEGQPVCSSLRLRRLLEAPKGESQLAAFRRALALLDHKANVRDLSRSLLEWNHPMRGTRRRQQWLYDYYHTDNPALSQPEEATL